MIYDNSLKASRYKLLGKEFTGDDVNIDIWYKDKMGENDFSKDGSTIEYFLKEYDSKKNKVAWITGGGTGIGKELALILAKKEYDVIISGRRKEKLIETANINKKRIHPISLDVNPNQCLKVSELFTKNLKKLIYLFSMPQFIVQDQLQKFLHRGKKVIDINLLGAINCLSPVAKVMQKNKKGHIVFVSSPAGYQGLPGGGFYGVSKSA